MARLGQQGARSGYNLLLGSGEAQKAILHQQPFPVRHLNPSTPAHLGEIIHKALEKDRNLRYQSAAEIRSGLQRLKWDTESGTQRDQRPR